MALVIYWYDFICFGIIGVSFLASSWILWRNELALNKRKDGSDQLWTSCWKGVHPRWLMATRLVSFLIMATLLTIDMMDWGVAVLIYYSGWTFLLLTVYFAIGTAMSAYGCWVSTMQTLAEDGESVENLRGDIVEFSNTHTIPYRRKKVRYTIKLQTHYAEKALRLRIGFCGYLMQTIYQTCAGAVILTDLSFWCVMVPFSSKEQLTLNMVIISMHTFNAGLLLLDIALNSMSFSWFGFAYYLIFGCIYCIFQWIIHARGFTWWPYPFLRLGFSSSPYWYLLLVVLHFPCYGIYALIIKTKYSLFSKWFPKAFVNLKYMIKHAKE